jgi:hypothetical protein
MCGKRSTFKVDSGNFKSWQTGALLIQDAMPEVSIENRELLISNTCGKCFDSLFPKEPEEEEECIYHPMVLNPNISMDHEVVNECYITAMRDYHVGNKVQHWVSAPGTGYIEWLITRMDETGVWGVKLLSTVRELTIEEVR